MRKLTLLSALFIFVLFSCSKTEDKNDKEVVKKVIVTGKILNPKSNKLSINYLFDYISNKDSVLCFDSLNENNEFRVEFDLDSPVYAKFNTSKEFTNLYLSPGDSLYITLDADAFDSTITYAGIGNEVNNYLAQKLLKSLSFEENEKAYYSQNQEDFYKTMDSINKFQLSNLENFGIQNATFVENEKQNLDYAFGISLLNYDDYNAYYSERNSSIELIDLYKSKISSYDYNNVGLLSNADFRGLLWAYHNYSLSTSDTENAFELSNQFKITDDIFSNDSVKSYVKGSVLSNSITYEGLSTETISEIEKYSKSYPNSRYVSILKEKSQKWEHLIAGKSAPTFAYYDKEGNTIALEDLKGKLVYIDVWATWCGPCMREAPYFQQLTEDFAGKGVVFLGVSIDDSEEAWMKYLNKKQPTSVQIFADKAWASSICSDYNISSIPRFLLIGKNGEIISANAARPSGSIREELNQLLGGV